MLLVSAWRILETTARTGSQEWQIRTVEGLKGELNLLFSLKMLGP